MILQWTVFDDDGTVMYLEHCIDRGFWGITLRIGLATYQESRVISKFCSREVELLGNFLPEGAFVGLVE